MDRNPGPQAPSDRSPNPQAPTSDEESGIRVIALEQSILEENDRVAAKNRAFLRSKGVYCLNLVSSPGSGKTTLLVRTLRELNEDLPCAVIEGDQQTSHDAQRIAETGVPVVQINTQHSCHLDARQVERALEVLPLDKTRILFIENVGNLICPAAFDLGQDETAVLMSITEGEDKPLKYPTAFRLARLLVLTKTDLLPHLRFDLDLCKQYAHRVNSSLAIIETSSYTGSGFPDWLGYLRSKVRVRHGGSEPGDLLDPEQETEGHAPSVSPCTS